MASDRRCNCMVLFDPPLPPFEHASDCPLRKGTIWYRSIDPDNPHDSDSAWTRDREEAEDEVEAFHCLGNTGYRLDTKIVLSGESLG